MSYSKFRYVHVSSSTPECALLTILYLMLYVRFQSQHETRPYNKIMSEEIRLCGRHFQSACHIFYKPLRRVHQPKPFQVLRLRPQGNAAHPAKIICLSFPRSAWYCIQDASRQIKTTLSSPQSTHRSRHNYLRLNSASAAVHQPSLA